MPHRNLDDVIGRHFAADKLMLVVGSHDPRAQRRNFVYKCHSRPFQRILFGEKT
ncbi:hypothetical protein ACVWW6_005590 [Bradyrhizobium sp. USDA 3311]